MQLLENIQLNLTYTYTLIVFNKLLLDIFRNLFCFIFRDQKQRKPFKNQKLFIFSL